VTHLLKIADYCTGACVARSLCHSWATCSCVCHSTIDCEYVSCFSA